MFIKQKIVISLKIDYIRIILDDFMSEQYFAMKMEPHIFM